MKKFIMGTLLFLIAATLVGCTSSGSTSENGSHASGDDAVNWGSQWGEVDDEFD